MIKATIDDHMVMYGKLVIYGRWGIDIFCPSRSRLSGDGQCAERPVG
jgi:hypothetical protein